jgi:hypothetical protein
MGRRPEPANFEARLRTNDGRFRGPELLQRMGYTYVRVRDGTADLLDANETTWAFVDVDHVGRVKKRQVKKLATLVSVGVCWNYCGRIADGRDHVGGIAHRVRTESVTGRRMRG